MENIIENNSTPDIVIEQEELLPQVESVIALMRSSEHKKSSYWGNISLLIITIVLFLGSGLINNPIVDVFFIIFVILIHEVGHLVTMKIYGYKDVKMFFIPFLGAAVSGKNYNISSSKKAIISLAGPVPGITIGFLLIIISVLTKSLVIYKLAIIFVYLNGINLLPLFPFDGGKFMSELFFIRNRYFEFIFKVIAIAIFIIAAIEFKDFILAIIGVTLFLSIGTSYKLATLAKEFKQKNNFNIDDTFLNQNNGVHNKIIYGLINKFPNPKGERFYENLTYDLWERIKYIPPKLSSTIGLSFGYFIPLFFVVILFLPVDNSKSEIANSNVYFGNEDKGNGIKYYPNGKVHIISSWKDGKKNGIWSEYDEKSNLTSKYLFDNDKFVCKIKYIGGGFDTLSFDKLTQEEKNFVLIELK